MSEQTGCPSCQSIPMAGPTEKRVLEQWPIQIKLMGSEVPFLKDADLMVAADCTAFAVKEFHEKFLGDKKLMIGCPKLDGGQLYMDKFAEMLANSTVKSVTVLRMEVPCCAGMTVIMREALKRAGKTNIPLREIVVGVRGETQSEKTIPVE